MTNAPTNGDLGGLSGADTICTDTAAAAELGGEWTAWLSDSTTDARDRIGDAEYQLVDATGTVVASSLADLTDGTLNAPINVTAGGTTIGAVSAWTGTQQNGTLAEGTEGTANEAACDDWKNGTTGEEGATGVQGSVIAADGGWTEIPESLPPGCASSGHLYCFSRRPFLPEAPFATTSVPEPSTQRRSLGGRLGASLGVDRPHP